MKALFKIAFKKRTIAKSLVGAGIGAYVGKKYDDMAGDPDDDHGRARRIGTGILAGAIAGPKAVPIAYKGAKKVIGWNNRRAVESIKSRFK